MKKIIPVYVFLLLQLGCSSTEQAMKRINNNFVGRKFTYFVTVYGAPYNSFPMGEGKTMYYWADSGSVQMPTQTSYSGQVYPSGYYSGSAMTTGGSVPVCCEIQVLVNSEGIIENISARRDTWGHWETSRCAEIFK